MKTTAKQLVSKFMTENDMVLESLGLSEYEEVQELLIAAHPQPSLNAESVTSCVNYAMWRIRVEEAMVEAFGKNFPFVIESCEWFTEQAIINRTVGNMAGAANDYIDGVIDRSRDMLRMFDFGEKQFTKPPLQSNLATKEI